MSDGEEDKTEELTEIERRILALEESWWTIAQTKDRAIEQELGMTPMRYYILLSRMLEEERVWRARPQLVDRLRRLRDKRTNERTVS
ncbi:DUF3263 domain-containing protein [Arcanobacterium phocae]|uniref:DUF3263 domain-containing protein n=1 Tax=Arcanobacterium phocae TaxID=131112 RepID=A0A1H2LCW9_9ACTO|nr:DUF3263 domain-containing protein [Arcanobacterium phocae]SDU78890.1 Protein of unknown function [Arcanobacterium phocae]